MLCGAPERELHWEGMKDRSDTAGWLNTREASRRLGISARGLYRLVDERQLVAYRFGSDVLLRASDVEAYGSGTSAPAGR